MVSGLPVSNTIIDNRNDVTSVETKALPLPGACSLSSIAIERF